MQKMKALSVAQPWAECIVFRGKNVENRSWNTKFRGYFAVHASASKNRDRFGYCREDYRIVIDPAEVAFGAVVGFAELVGVVTSADVDRTTKKWFQGEFGFVLKNIIRLKDPVRVKGALGFWNLRGKVLSACLNQLSPAQIRKIERSQAKAQRY